jgi:hypothetical protein
MEDTRKHMEEEYYRLSRAINKGINKLGSKGSSVTRNSTPTMAPSTLSRILAEMDMDLAEAEGQVSFPFEIMGSNLHIRSYSAEKKLALGAVNVIFIMHHSMQPGGERRGGCGSRSTSVMPPPCHTTGQSLGGGAPENECGREEDMSRQGKSGWGGFE